jgi:Raf kinase inhibitor-like YbhB/YbcL family protein
MPLNIKDLKIESPAFGEGERIPAKHTGEGEDVSPPLRWSGVPEGTRQLVLICHDPDAPLPHGFTHWVLAGIPPTATGLDEGDHGGHVQGSSDFGRQAYGGPMPPEGHGTHRYYFWIYALDTEIDAKPGVTRLELLDAIGDHVIEQARVVGTYDR